MIEVWGLSSDGELTLDVFHIGLVDQCGMCQSTLAIFRFLGQDVTLERVLSLDFTRTGQLETLLGRGLGFHFWHSSQVLVFVAIF